MQASGEHTQASSIYKIYQSLCNISVLVSQCNISVSVFKIYTGSLDFVGSSTGSASMSIYIFFNISVNLHDIYQSSTHIYIYNQSSLSLQTIFTVAELQCSTQQSRVYLGFYSNGQRQACSQLNTQLSQNALSPTHYLHVNIINIILIKQFLHEILIYCIWASAIKDIPRSLLFQSMCQRTNRVF